MFVLSLLSLLLLSPTDSFQHIKTDTQRSPLDKSHFQINFFARTFIYLDTTFIEIYFQRSINNKPVEIGSEKVPDGTKPLPEPMPTYHQRCSVAFTREQFYKKRS